ncbi:ANTAR domain-containing protein [Mycobacteroides abscessus]|jgi:hypothetical protein|uniref:RNA-binding protein n=2 Tax=Mycobacteriaceae TaxID=1762 RepID=A0AB38D7Q9_9MYCO|nr:ANTAR domain-containing protein [Mycobacteroides abscessus]MBN7297547.1 ANTAR domain-containing protein [Mycobacteroides abscessus subsp. abscessus]MBN7459469.1 ANTAR domain-containing protein [Mycobacteroides abscessus subsp. abscessus]MBN7557588.1 ANTAR domain-containing protein [Mycobacteroides abscessus subsp. abscessus]MDM2407601.1 ANTAR domain-containing protein [Mycobacteroides abscessus]MDM2417989.1 ANTAR domain-containing protein [Mycobacteroides abscessus]
MTDLSRRTHPASRRVIDLATGILMGLRGCSEQEAFNDLVATMHETGSGPDTLAQALIDLVTGSPATSPHHAEAIRQWGRLLPDRATYQSH